MFRESSDEIRNAFAPLADWWALSRQERIRIYKLRGDYYWSDGKNLWCRPVDFLRSLIFQKTKCPDLLTGPVYPCITTVRWKITMSKDERYVVPRYRLREERIRIPNPVYRCTLRLLERWISETDGLDRDQYRARCSPNRVNDYRYRDCGCKLIALCLMRKELETNWSQYYPLNFDEPELFDSPRVNIPDYQERTPRIAWRAKLLGIYATWYYLVIVLKKNSKLQLNDIPWIGDGSLFSYSETIGTSPYGPKQLCGEVVFPCIPGLHRFLRLNPLPSG